MSAAPAVRADRGRRAGRLFAGVLRDRAAVAGLAWSIVAVMAGGVTVLRFDGLRDYAGLLGLTGLLLYAAALLPVLAVEVCLLPVPAARRTRARGWLLSAVLLLVSPLLTLEVFSTGEPLTVSLVLGAIGVIGLPAVLLGWLLFHLVRRMPVGLRQLLAGPVALA